MNVNPYSKVSQDFIWVGEYASGEFIKEFDIDKKMENSFYAIERNSLIRFGLVGHGMKLFHEVFGGHFKVNGQVFDFVYKDGNEEYALTGQPMMYNDIISFKDAESIAKMSRDVSGRFINRITQFNVGYKTQLTTKGVTFGLRVLVCIPYDKPAYFLVRLVANKDMRGKLTMNKNGKELSSFDFPLMDGVGGEMKFIIK